MSDMNPDDAVNPADTAPDVPDAPALAGIAGIGPARRRSLAAAGVTTREQMGRLSVEQLVGLTGMPRAQAERVLSALLPPGSPPPTPPAVLEADDPAAPDAGAEPPTTSGVEDDAPEPPDALPPGRLDAATFRLRTAASDLFRVADVPRLEKPLAKIVLLLDDLPQHSDRLSPKRRRKLTEELESLAERLERVVAAASGGLTEQRQKRLRERLRDGRRQVADLLRVKPRRKSRYPHS